MTRSALDIERVWTLMREIGTCMLASHESGMIRARPMTARPQEEENAIYFLTSARGDKDEEIEANDGVCLTFHQGGKYLVVTGRARVLNDRLLIGELWAPPDAAWWRDREDPDIRAIEISPIDAQFWEGPHGIFGAAAMVLAATSHSRPILGGQRKVQLS